MSDRIDELHDEIADLKAQLSEAQDTLAAIRAGDVDALVVGDDVYTLVSASATEHRLGQHVLAQMEEAVVAFDLAGRLIFMNAAAERQYDVEASQMLGRSRSEIYQESAAQPEVEATEVGQPRSRKTRSVHVRHDGTSVDVETTISHLLDGSGGAIGRLHVIRDVSERMRSDAALREADRRKDEFLATLAHELRNPIAPIVNAIEILRRDSHGETAEHARQIIARQMTQMVHLVDDLLDVSRISRGTVELRRERVDLLSIVHAAVETSRPLIEQSAHRLVLELPEEGAAIVSVDPTRATQIVANLLNNAAKYTLPGGNIVVSLATMEGEARLKVADSGIGIPPEMLPRIFDMFTRVDRDMERKQGGLGIGLALVRKLTELHGGSVEAQSDGVGRGSIFTVRLPVLSGSVGAKPPARAHQVAAGGGRRVLVIDDNRDNADTLAIILESQGYDVRAAYSGESGLACAAEFGPEVVLLDIGLPDVSGHDVARQLRASPGGADLFIVAVSGWGQSSDRLQSSRAGFDQHLVKPVDVEKLLEWLAKRG